MGLALPPGRVRLRVGAFVLFGKESAQDLLQRDFTFVSYDNSEGMYSFREDLSLPVTRLFDRLMELLRPHLRKVRGVSALKRRESSSYPEDAIREALLTAFGHRDYRLAGLRNACRLYPDRLEVISAGGLPPLVTLKRWGSSLFTESKLMHALTILGYVEGTGPRHQVMRDSLKQKRIRLLSSNSNEIFKVVFQMPSMPAQVDWSLSRNSSPAGFCRVPKSNP